MPSTSTIANILAPRGTGSNDVSARNSDCYSRGDLGVSQLIQQ